MKKKELETTLQVTKAYNDLLIQMIQQSQKQSSNGITDAFATDNQEYESLEEKSQYLDQLEESSRHYSEQKRQASTLLALYEERLNRADKGRDTTDKKLKKAIHKLGKDEYSCAVKPHVRSDGNRQSGTRKPLGASLLA